MSKPQSLKLTFECTEHDERDAEQKVRLSIPLPPPKPAADGYGNPVAHLPPQTGVIVMNVTSEERQALYYERDKLQRQAKKIRPENVEDEKEREALREEKQALEDSAAQLGRLMRQSDEFRFEKGKTYEVTIREVKP